jgi:hypothetical protein
MELKLDNKDIEAALRSYVRKVFKDETMAVEVISIRGSKTDPNRIHALVNAEPRDRATTDEEKDHA